MIKTTPTLAQWAFAIGTAQQLGTSDAYDVRDVRVTVRHEREMDYVLSTGELAGDMASGTDYVRYDVRADASTETFDVYRVDPDSDYAEHVSEYGSVYDAIEYALGVLVERDITNLQDQETVSTEQVQEIASKMRAMSVGTPDAEVWLAGGVVIAYGLALQETWYVGAWRPDEYVAGVAVDRKTSGWRRPYRLYAADQDGEWGELLATKLWLEDALRRAVELVVGAI